MAHTSSSKRACVVAAGSDLLSSLPDELLYCVMSFLTAQQAVQTGALSRRWRDLWYSMPCLDIDYHKFVQTLPAATSGATMAWRRFENFTANLLMYHRAPVLDRFRLSVRWCGSRELELVERWVRRGIGYRPVVLEVTMSLASTLKFPSDLWLAPRLKRLQLRHVLLDGSFAGLLRLRCPVLEDLELHECDCDFQEIASAILKRLAIESCSNPVCGGRRLTVTAPTLVSLRLAFPRCTDQDVLLVNGAEFLSQASINGCLKFVGTNLFRCLGSLCNIRTLELWSFSYPNAKLSNKEKEMFPKLNNLTTLLMGKCDMSKQFDILQLFLKNAPSLDKVTLSHCMIYRKKGALRKIAPRYLKLISFESKDLKLIEIKYKDGNASKLFGLLMGIRWRLDKNTVVLIKER
ncbi:unnamed protein product [Urochloa decumbens]|uniref:F-box domain-containing protein n=1 Tax=Urochloa decumbens TaxID=240449 RepID=A0ABC9F174_9POAL